MTIDLTQRVAAGIEWLDATIPGWRSRIDTTELDMSSGHYCILGQAHCGDYLDALDQHAGAPDPYSNMAEAWAVEHGFTVSRDHDYEEGWSALQNAWLDALAEPA